MRRHYFALMEPQALFSLHVQRFACARPYVKTIERYNICSIELDILFVLRIYFIQFIITLGIQLSYFLFYY